MYNNKFYQEVTLLNGIGSTNIYWIFTLKTNIFTKTSHNNGFIELWNWSNWNFLQVIGDILFHIEYSSILLAHMLDLQVCLQKQAEKDVVSGTSCSNDSCTIPNHYCSYYGWLCALFLCCGCSNFQCKQWNVSNDSSNNSPSTNLT